MIELYHNFTSVCAAKVRMTLVEKGVDWTGHFVDLFGGATYRPDYLRLNPLGVIPTLVVDGTPLIESTLINEYIDDAVPTPPLRPADPVARHRMRLWTKQLDDSIHDACGIVSNAIAYRHFHDDKTAEQRAAHIAAIPVPARRPRARELMDRGIEASYFPGGVQRMDKMLADMDTALESGPWLAGEAFSLADIGIAPYVLRLDQLALARLWDHRPRVAGWYERLNARPAYRTAILEHALKAPYIEMMAETGTAAWPRIKEILGR